MCVRMSVPSRAVRDGIFPHCAGAPRPIRSPDPGQTQGPPQAQTDAGAMRRELHALRYVFTLRYVDRAKAPRMPQLELDQLHDGGAPQPSPKLGLDPADSAGLEDPVPVPAVPADGSARLVLHLSVAVLTTAVWWFYSQASRAGGQLHCLREVIRNSCAGNGNHDKLGDSTPR